MWGAWFATLRTVGYGHISRKKMKNCNTPPHLYSLAAIPFKTPPKCTPIFQTAPSFST